jgi:hypothetical protein
MKSSATTVARYLASLPPDRRDAIARVRDAINARLPDGYEERMQWGMIAWAVPESVLPARDVYNKQPLCLVALASQKSYMAVHMLGAYLDSKERAWFDAAYKKSGKKLDMGQGCVRFRTIDALAVDVVAEALSRVSVEDYVATYRRVRESRSKPAGKKPAAKKPAAKKSAAKKPAAKTSVVAARSK